MNEQTNKQPNRWTNKRANTIHSNRNTKQWEYKPNFQRLSYSSFFRDGIDRQIRTCLWIANNMNGERCNDTGCCSVGIAIDVVTAASIAEPISSTHTNTHIMPWMWMWMYEQLFVIHFFVRVFFVAIDGVVVVVWDCDSIILFTKSRPLNGALISKVRAPLKRIRARGWGEILCVCMCARNDDDDDGNDNNDDDVDNNDDYYAMLFLWYYSRSF